MSAKSGEAEGMGVTDSSPKVFVWDEKSAFDLDKGDGCTTLSMY